MSTYVYIANHCAGVTSATQVQGILLVGEMNQNIVIVRHSPWQWLPWAHLAASPRYMSSNPFQIGNSYVLGSFETIPNSTSPLSPWETPRFNRSRFRIFSPTLLPRKMPPSVLLGKAEASTPAAPASGRGCSIRRPALMAGRVGPAPERLRWGSSSGLSSRESLLCSPCSPALRVSWMARSAFLMAARLALPLDPPSMASEVSHWISGTKTSPSEQSVAIQLRPWLDLPLVANVAQRINHCRRISMVAHWYSWKCFVSRSAAIGGKTYLKPVFWAAGTMNFMVPYLPCIIRSLDWRKDSLWEPVKHSSSCQKTWPKTQDAHSQPGVGLLIPMIFRISRLDPVWYHINSEYQFGIFHRIVSWTWGT